MFDLKSRKNHATYNHFGIISKDEMDGRFGKVDIAIVIIKIFYKLRGPLWVLELFRKGSPLFKPEHKPTYLTDKNSI